MPKSLPPKRRKQSTDLAVESITAEVMPVGMNLEQSYAWTAQKLAEVREGMIASDRAIFTAVGEFSQNVGSIVESIIETALDDEITTAPDLEHSNLAHIKPKPQQMKETLTPNQSQNQNQLLQQLQQRFNQIRAEADYLLLNANNDTEIARALQLEQFLERIKQRIFDLQLSSQLSAHESVPMQISPTNTTVTYLHRLSLKQLQDMAKRNNLKGYSSLNKTALINKLNGLIG